MLKVPLRQDLSKLGLSEQLSIGKGVPDWTSDRWGITISRKKKPVLKGQTLETQEAPLRFTSWSRRQ